MASTVVKTLPTRADEGQQLREEEEGCTDDDAADEAHEKDAPDLDEDRVQALESRQQFVGGEQLLLHRGPE